MEKRERKPEFVNRYTGEELSVYPISGIYSKDSRSKEEDVKARKEKFVGKCPCCKEPLEYHGGNVLTCSNVKCKGVPHKSKVGDEEVTVYSPYFKLVSSSYGSYGKLI